MNFLFIFFIFLGSLKTYPQDNSKIAVIQIFINDIYILLLYILPEWLFDKGSFIWLLIHVPFFKSYYFSHLILVTLNTRSFTSFNKWLSGTDNCHWTFICIWYIASCWLPSWENLIYYDLPHLPSFLSWEIINPTYSHHLSCCLTQLMLIGVLKQQWKFL